MELRDIEIFLVLSEELHFGRTAERLFISPARVSQVIKELERRIGASLFDRTSRSVVLTEVGRQFRDDLQPVYVGLHDSLERARMSARGVTARLRVGLMPFNFAKLWHYWRAFRGQYPQWDLQVRVVSYTEPFAQLRSGEFDVFVAWLPIEEPDLTVGPTLLADPRVLAVADNHPLAMRSSAPLELLADFPHASNPLNLDYWEEGYLPFQTRRGRTIERSGPLATNADDLISAVGMGDIIMAFPSHVTEYWAIPDISYLPIPDLSALNYVLVWRTETENDVIRALAKTVSDMGPLRL